MAADLIVVSQDLETSDTERPRPRSTILPPAHPRRPTRVREITATTVEDYVGYVMASVPPLRSTDNMTLLWEALPTDIDPLLDQSA